MKKWFLYLILIPFLFFISVDLPAQTGIPDIKTKGTLSPDSENTNEEIDSKYISPALNPSMFKKVSSSENQQQVSKLEHGMEIVTEIIHRFIQPEYGFVLLSSHKYMVNDCLGIKVSSGDFNLRFSNPMIDLSNSGQLKIKLEVNKIKFSALKIRIKPRVPDLSDPNPCHFSGKFEIGGEATDLSVTITINLLTNGLEGSAGFCYFAFGSPYDIKWKIGGLNLRPHPNTLDNVIKEMVEDALNQGMVNLFYNKFIQLSKQVIPQYYQACNEIYNSDNISKGVTTISNPASSDQANEKWTLTPNNLKGTTGRLMLDFPTDTKWQVNIWAMPGKQVVANLYSTANKTFHTVAPGMYRIKLNTVELLDVPIEKGHDTKLNWGILDIVSETNWILADESGKANLNSGNKPIKMALPVGTYTLKLGGQPQEVIIKKGETVEM